ncbi:MAG: glycosyltransferase [Flavobacteriaceae bacterium]|nr:glycosyltransferase [Flavobacteriaceae bacterium]|tara:strand:+ start:76183 stop:77349 length:1167 start_codon:yes stop_codon:yes gene_type:complete
MQQLKCCVVMATYNNEITLPKILDGVLTYTEAIILVNDGSTDLTEELLVNYQTITILHLPKNKGKGNALKKGFKKALEMGYERAITLDTDGQHFPDDLPAFITALEKSEDKNLFIIGDRNMNEADVLATSAKGNRVSGFWVRSVTGLQLTDTQSGFRLYPIKALQKIRFLRWTSKFEFETEVIVRSHWRGIRVMNIPIKVLYPKDRVSHFRPFMDIARIVVLIIGFLIVKGFYIIPRDFFRQLKKKGFKKFFVEDFLSSGDSSKKKALSIALGVFLGLSPLWGFHTVIVIFLAIFFRLNKVIAFAFSNISLPPFIPFVLWASVRTGNFVLGESSSFSMAELSDFDAIKHLESYLVGSIVLSVTSAIVFGIVGYLMLKLFEPNKQVVDA